MDIDLRLILLFLGFIVIAVIVWDFYRKKRKQVDQSEEYTQEALDEMMESRDNGGFDLTGVGLSRIIGDEAIEVNDEPMVATRDDGNIVTEESMTASRQDELNLEESEKEPQETEFKETVEPDLIISMSIIARSDTGFVGENMLHCMLSKGLRFGEMNIFHRHKNTSGNGSIQFSLANAVKPGTFDLDDMSTFQTKGVTLFMILPGPKEPLKSYKLMLDTAQHLASELDGQLVDSSRSVLTQQTIQHFNEQIQDFERRNLSKPKD